MVKVGLEAFVAHGPALVEELAASGHRIFLDLKLHDIPRTAAAAASMAKNAGVELLTIHASGGTAMVAAVRDAIGDSMAILAVTILTSIDDAGLREIGMRRPIADHVHELASLSIAAGAHGVVCSGMELERLKDLPGLRVVPGVRPEGAERSDQRRVVTPAAAIAQGADYLVIGRPIVASQDPVSSARSIAASICSTSHT